MKNQFFPPQLILHSECLIRKKSREARGERKCNNRCSFLVSMSDHFQAFQFNQRGTKSVFSNIWILRESVRTIGDKEEEEQCGPLLFISVETAKLACNNQ
jgi:hypothetical protein